MQLDEWKTISVTHTIPACRTGWPGVWDAFIAALLRRKVFATPTPVCFSVRVKGGGVIAASSVEPDTSAHARVLNAITRVCINAPERSALSRLLYSQRCQLARAALAAMTVPTTQSTGGDDAA